MKPSPAKTAEKSQKTACSLEVGFEVDSFGENQVDPTSYDFNTAPNVIIDVDSPQWVKWRALAAVVFTCSPQEPSSMLVASEFVTWMAAHAYF